MTTRTWLYGLLTEPELPYDAHLRVFPKKSMVSSIEEHPFLVYKLGNDTNEGLSEESTAHRQFVQIWVHDHADAETGDYTQIDEVIEALKLRLHLAESPENHVLQLRFLETSQDLNDETLSTVFRYMRLQMIVGS